MPQSRLSHPALSHQPVMAPQHRHCPAALSQPALFVAGLAAVERLRTQSPTTVEGCSACAGLSLGEYAALVFAGVLSFEDGLKVRWVWGGWWGSGGGGGKQHGVCSRCSKAPARHSPAPAPSPPSWWVHTQVVKVRAESMLAAAQMGKPHGMLSGERASGQRDVCACVC